MPQPELACRYQKAVLWPADGYDSYGQPKVGTPVEISVRWNTKRRQSVSAEGNPIALDATVIVAQTVTVGSVMWLGELAEWYGTGSLGDQSGLMEVLTYSETPDLKNRVVRRELGLAFYRDTLPELS